MQIKKCIFQSPKSHKTCRRLEEEGRMVFTIKYDRVGIRNHAILSKFEDFLLRMLLSVFSNYGPVQVHLQRLGDSTMHFWMEKIQSN